MCGLAGFMLVNPEKTAGTKLAQVAIGMSVAIEHRGVDDAGAWCEDSAGVAMAHRRLAILDLSEKGHQPMASMGGRYVICFNGEIYNHKILRVELETSFQGIRWIGNSDTETLLMAFEFWGVLETLNKTVGMFAFSLWDHKKKLLTLARDRFGEKPLFYGWIGNAANRAFAFGSELKALRAYPNFSNDICRAALAKYMQHCYVPAPYSIYKNIYKLEPGCLLEINQDGLLQQIELPVRAPYQKIGLVIKRWWQLSDVVDAGAADLITSDRRAIQEVDATLEQAVLSQSIADVPVGVFLSGGIDSTTIASLIQKTSSVRVKTFTIGFDDPRFDESSYASEIARQLGTDPNEFRITANDARDVIPLLPRMYDEPFSDSSQIPTHLVSVTARKQVKVALSGDGGDELFGGYNRYFWGPRIWDRFQHLPFAVRKSIGHLLNSVPAPIWDSFNRSFKGIMPKSMQVAQMGDKVHKLSQRLRTVHNYQDLYRSLVTEWEEPTDIVLADKAEINQSLDVLDLHPPKLELSDPCSMMMYLDSMTYLPDDILCKVDRASMAVGLEARNPFLDHRVAELAWRLPLKMKVRNGEGKWVLRQVLNQYVPIELFDRPKAGFSMPVGIWLTGPLLEWAEELLSETKMSQEGYLNARQVQELWMQHKSGRRDWTARLWCILMFQAWLRSSQ